MLIESQTPPIPVQGIVFDCDGTLLDSMPAWQSMEFKLASKAKLALTPAQLDQLNANTLDQTARFFHEVGGLGSSVAEVKDHALQHLMDYYRNQVEAKPGVKAFVRAMDEMGVRMSVASSSPHEILDAGLIRTGLEPYMQAIVSVTDTGKSKRDPATINAAFKTLGVPRAATWGFEDSVYAIKVLKNNGFKAMGIYDTDTAGSFQELSKHADHAVWGFSQINVDRFVNNQYA